MDDLVSSLTDGRAGGRAGGDSFDLVVLAYVHPDPSDRAELLAAAVDSLSPGGHLFVVGHHLPSLGVTGPPDPARFSTEDDLRAILGLDVLRLEQRRGESDISEPGTDVILWARGPNTLTQAS